MPAELSREDYALRYGPTTGDLVRLGDTNLWIRVERDDVAYGDELTYGWAQTVRTGMAIARRASPGLPAITANAVSAQARSSSGTST